MGTPEFAVPTLSSLIENGYEVLAVVTQPDRPKGRGQKLAFPPVKEKALDYGLPVFQPENINNPGFITTLRKFNPELIVVVAFGQLLGKEILNLPKLGCINVHASLLPEYRGAAPIHRAIIDGKQQTGITIMYMAEKLDAGDMLLQERLEIGQDDNLGVLHDKLAKLGGQALTKTLDVLEKGKSKRVAQDESQVTYAEKIEKKDVEIDWGKSTQNIRNLVRGTNPWPGAYTYLDEQLWKIWQVDVQKGAAQGSPGQLMVIDNKRIVVNTGDGLVELIEIQPQNSRRMKTSDYLKGHRLEGLRIFGGG